MPYKPVRRNIWQERSTRSDIWLMGVSYPNICGWKRASVILLSIVWKGGMRTEYYRENWTLHGLASTISLDMDNQGTLFSPAKNFSELCSQIPSVPIQIRKYTTVPIPISQISNNDQGGIAIDRPSTFMRSCCLSCNEIVQ